MGPGCIVALTDVEVSGVSYFHGFFNVKGRALVPRYGNREDKFDGVRKMWDTFNSAWQGAMTPGHRA